MDFLASKTKRIGILTSGGDCPGLNPTLRGLVKSAIHIYGMEVIGIKDGFRGLVENRTIPLTDSSVSGILTVGGTILGTSRDKPHKMPIDGVKKDMTDAAVKTYHDLELDCLVCLGGGGTQKNALHLHTEGGINVLTLPKTIDNDVMGTDMTFGFDTALQVATDAIDRLHSTATSHKRVIICEIMGHKAGWLALGAGIAGGADVILIPEIPYDMDAITEALMVREKIGKKFSIIALAEGARSLKNSLISPEQRKVNDKVLRNKLKEVNIPLIEEPLANKLARKIAKKTGLETRVTVLGHIQRGGSPSAGDRLLSTQFGARAARFLANGTYNVMVGLKGQHCQAVPLNEVAGKDKLVPLDHPWIMAARLSGISFGD